MTIKDTKIVNDREVVNCSNRVHHDERYKCEFGPTLSISLYTNLYSVRCMLCEKTSNSYPEYKSAVNEWNKKHCKKHKWDKYKCLICHQKKQDI